MNNLFFTLLKKEIKEQIKSSKLIVFAAIFLFFGLMSPIAALYMPQIIASVRESQNISIVVPEPTWLDAVAQYMKNLTQMSSFILILVYMGLISKEKETGTLMFLLVKPVKRSTFIISKFSSVVVAAIVSMSLSFFAAAFYTFLFFKGFKFDNFAFLNLIMLEYILSLLFMTLTYSTIFKSQILAGVFSFVSFLVLSLLAQINQISEFLPSGLIEQSSNAISGSAISVVPIISSFVFMSICILISLRVFQKWEA
jgi:ABC-2 type transport system permease protein